MSKRIVFIFLTSLVISGSAYAQSSLPSRFQSWNEVQLALPLLKGKDRKGKTIDKVTATFNGTARLGRKDVELVDGRISATLDYRVHKNVTLMSAVLYRSDELTPNVRRYETRFDLGAVFSTTWKNFTFRDRNMYEHRFRNGRRDTDLYRNRIQVSYPIKYKGKDLFTPFISEEGYYNLTQKNWSQNEFFAGISRRLNKRTVIDIAYVRNDTEPVNVNGLALTLKIRLKD